MDAAQGEKIAHSQSRDLLSLLVRANMVSDPRERLSDTDVLARKSIFRSFLPDVRTLIHSCDRDTNNLDCRTRVNDLRDVMDAF
jgi:hypothetical protein